MYVVKLCLRLVGIVSLLVAALLACVGQKAGAARLNEGQPLGKLFWGDDPATGQPWHDVELATALNAGDEPDLEQAIQQADAWLSHGNSFPAVNRIAIAGHLPAEPEFKRSVAALKAAKWLVPLALCARVGTHSLRERCRESASAGVFAWVETYKQPTGNPIDEGGLLPVLMAADLLLPTWDADQQAAFRAWGSALLASSQLARSRTLADPHATTEDNWETWRLMIALIDATVLDDSAAVSRLTAEWHAHAARNLGADGRTWDFRRRGAMHYQVYDLEPMLWLRLFVPETISFADNARLKAAVYFLRPYVEGRSRFVEFAHPDTSLAPAVAFDKTRAQAGMAAFQQKEWAPSEASALLYIAALSYPEIAHWSWPGAGQNVSILERTVAALRVSGHEGPGACSDSR